MKKVATLTAATMLSLGATAYAMPANKMDLMCGANGGIRNGNCAFHIGCTISKTVGAFDCYQEIPSEIQSYWPDDNGFENPFVPEPIENEVAPETKAVETPTEPAPAREAVAMPSGGGGGEGVTGGIGTLSGPTAGFFDAPQGSRGGGYLLGNGSDYSGSGGFGLGANIDFGGGGGSSSPSGVIKIQLR